MKKPTVRIAANDSALAHAMSRHELDRLRNGSRKLYERLWAERMSIPGAAKLIRAHFGPLMLRELIVRPHGSRAQAMWAVLDVEIDPDYYPEDLILAHLSIRKGLFNIERLAVRLSPHVVARFFQRTLLHADVRKVARLNMHVEHVLSLLAERRLKVGDGLTTVTTDGALLWETIPKEVDDEPSLRGKTWLDKDTAVDPALIEAMRAVTDDQIGVRPLVKKPEHTLASSRVPCVKLAPRRSVWRRSLHTMSAATGMSRCLPKRGFGVGDTGHGMIASVRTRLISDDPGQRRRASGVGR